MKTDEELWTELLDVLKISAMGEPLTEIGIAQIMPKMAALGLILQKPFDWMHWTEPYPSTDQLVLMDLQTALKQIFRIHRAERFMEGTFQGAINSGVLLGLCLVVRQHTGGKSVPRLFKT